MFSNTPGSIENYVNYELRYLEAPLKTGGHSAHPRVTAPVTRYLLVSLADRNSPLLIRLITKHHLDRMFRNVR